MNRNQFNNRYALTKWIPNIPCNSDFISRNTPGNKVIFKGNRVAIFTQLPLKREIIITRNSINIAYGNNS